MRRIWNRMSITKKLLLATMAVFLLFCMFILFGQITFFESYYTYIKSGEVKKAVSEFSEVYADYNDSDTVRLKMTEISDENECYMMVMDESGAVKHMLSYEMTVETSNGELVRISLDNAVNSKTFNEMQLAVGDEVEVEFFGNRNDFRSHTFFPVKISTGDKEWTISRPDNIEAPRDAMRRMPPREINDKIKGTVIRLVLPSEHTRNINSEREVAAKAAFDWVNNRKPLAKDETSSYYYTEPESSEKFSVVVKSLSDYEGDMIFAIAPLNMVTEAVDIASHIYYLFFVLSMVTACALGIIFARAVTRPIIEMTKVTKAMSELDFTAKCEHRSNDEIGELADNINMLSASLDSAIVELQGANEKLKEDIERERLMEKTRREFVAAASHELKTPLAIIRAYTEALIDDISVNKRQHYSEVIISETEKMDNLILDMLDNTKYEVGAQKPVLSKCDLSALAEGILGRFAEIFNKKSIALEKQFDSRPVLCSFDVDMIERVIINFVANAASHTSDNGKVKVIVSKLDDTAVFSIENTSLHISDEELEHIWDKFYKADKSRRRRDGGTGLGLSIAKNILNLHKAEYGAENTQDGVRFYFKISDNI